MSKELIEGSHTSKVAYTERFFDSSKDFFSFFKKSMEEPSNQLHSGSIDVNHTPDRPQNNVTDLLKAAYSMLDRAQSQLEEKQDRIKKLEAILTIDELTGLTNRRGFFEAFKGELGRTSRGENRGGLLLMIDLDRFKAINDTYGHLAGDRALCVVAEFLQNSIRPMDMAARLGGDEFVLLFPNTCIAKAMKRADKLEKDLNSMTFQWDGKRIPIYASLGLKDYGVGDTIEHIIQSADSGMYSSKAERRNNVH